MVPLTDVLLVSLLEHALVVGNAVFAVDVAIGHSISCLLSSTCYMYEPISKGEVPERCEISGPKNDIQREEKGLESDLPGHCVCCEKKRFGMRGSGEGRS